MKRTGLNYSGDIPPSFRAIRLYKGPVECSDLNHVFFTQTMGLQKDRFDPKEDVSRHWLVAETPEWQIGDSAFSAWVEQNVFKRNDVSMYWKMHLALSKEGQPFIAVNPVQYERFHSERQNEVLPEFERLIKEVERDSPGDREKLLTHLRKAKNKFKRNPHRSVFRFYDRDHIAVALTMDFAFNQGIGIVAFPSEETLRKKWRDIPDKVVQRYDHLRKFALSCSKPRLTVCEFSPRMELTEIGKTGSN